MENELRRQLLRAISRDSVFLRKTHDKLDPQDFPTKEEQLIVSVSLQYYQKYNEPIGGMLRAVVGEDAAAEKWGAQSKQTLRDLIDTIQGRMELVAVEALVDRVKTLKRVAFYDQAVEEVITAHEKGKLTPQTLEKLFEKAQRHGQDSEAPAHDYYSLEERRKRAIRRKAQMKDRYPLVNIPGLDGKCPRILGPGQFGMVLADSNAGKGMCLLHFADAYSMQGLKVLHFTLEDPLDMVEDRLDSQFTGIPMSQLVKASPKVRKRWLERVPERQGHIRIIDATDGDWTVTRMIRVVREQRAKGYDADVVIIDYDDEIVCEEEFKGESARRKEFAEIYRRLRVFAKTEMKIVWTASQASRRASRTALITKDMVAEDYSKIRKVFFCLGIGVDSEYPDQKTLSVLKNRNGRNNVIVKIVSDYALATFCDVTETEALQKHLAGQDA